MEIKNRNLFRLTRIVIFRISALFRFFGGFRAARKRLLIIKPDAIGDYILFRNFLEIVKRSERFKDYEIDLVGNSLWADIALKYDGAFITRFFFTRHYQLYEAPLQLLKLGWKLFKRRYEVVLQPSSTRLLITDGLAALTAAEQIIGYVGDTEGMQLRYKNKADKFYTEKLLLPAEIYFEFNRHKYFFEQVLKQAVNIVGPHIETEITHRRGIVIFPGAGIMKRGWEPDNFLHLIKKMLQSSAEDIFIAGGPGEKPIGEYLTANLPVATVNNRIDQTTLPQLIELIASAKLVISNETSAIHIAAATATPCVCILGGGHFGRFAPYPAHVPNAPICVYHAMDCFNCNWNCIYQTDVNEPYPCINKVDINAIWNVVKPLIKPVP